MSEPAGSTTRRVMRKWMDANPRDSFAVNGPIKRDFKATYLADLRSAGMPD
jgi:hypothetical protein